MQKSLWYWGWLPRNSAYWAVCPLIGRFREISENVRTPEKPDYTTYKNGDAFQKGYIIRAGMFELFVDEKKSLKIHEKEPFYWLSLIEFPRWLGY